MAKKTTAVAKKQPGAKRSGGKKRLAELGDYTSQGITVKFAPQTLSQLRLHAQMKGVGPTTLIRMWVLERLQEIEN